MQPHHSAINATRPYSPEAITVDDEAIMAYQDHESRRCVRTDFQLMDCSEDFDMSHWLGNQLVSQRPLEMHYHFSSGHQLLEGQDWVRDPNITSPPCHPLPTSRYPSYHSPNEEPQHPYYSSPSTLYNNSSASSDRLSPSIGSRASSLLPSPHLCHLDVPALEFISHSDEYYENPPCVAMQNVQKTADAMNEDPVDDYIGYEYEAQEPQELVPVASDFSEAMTSTYGQHPIPVAYQETLNESSSEPSPEPASISEPESDYNPGPSPAVRRCRAAKQAPTAIIRGHNRVTKRRLPLTKPPRSSHETPRAFLCPLAPYGCKSAFNAKNEWKRHAMTQHFRMGFWRCDQCTESPDRPNDFNRKDLFVQHVRRMHPTNTVVPAPNNSKKKGRAQDKVATVEAALNNIAERCYQLTHSAPESCCCVFCEETFEGEGAMESRTEHVGKHMESRRKEGLDPVAVGDWREDKELESWLLLHGMIGRKNGALEVLK
jgi:hypothetical protein